ncbi:uncharacterized protein LOC123552271 [Mercenaria mercenaria]|uniref:uncharacterized protein LOC123552271 n=1 Tax=Mercenaria mercenaria TaxID=6596 RepID=UPI00234F39C6|nr:uncharacterized protein LOC123552271 [Mercenaria mercenaria]
MKLIVIFISAFSDYKDKGDCLSELCASGFSERSTLHMVRERAEFSIETMERQEGWCKRNQKLLIFFLVFVLVVGCLVYFGYYQTKLNRDLIDTVTSELASDNQYAGSLFGGLPASGLGQAAATADARKYYLNIGMRQDYLLQECQGTYYKLSFPDVDYALMGYNVLRGYPLATGHDPGFTYPIFSADYGNGLQTADCRYSVPKGLVVVPDVSCVTSFSSQVVQTKYEFANSLSVSASVSGGGWGASFSASAGYKESSSEISTGESVYIISSASCNYYFSKLVKRSPPPFDPVFLSWIQRLNTKGTKAKKIYLEFFDTYGTHFATEVTFGARFTYEHKMSSKKYETQSEQGVNVAVQASYSGLFSVGGGFSMDSSQKEAASDFSKSVETKTITVGAAPPANGDAMTWASTVKNSPVPSKYKLSSMEELFTETYIDSAKLNVNLTLISQNIRKFKYEYCKHLMFQGEVETCESLSPGMMLEKTILYGHYETKALSYKECIDHCLKQIKCVAIDYCDQCDSSSGSYHTCYLYKTGEQGSADNNDKWKSIFFVGKMKAQLELLSTEVIGTERGFETEEDKNANATRCNELCADDAHCIVYSYCKCPDVEQKCKLYSFANVFGFRKAIGTKSVFVPKYEE